MGMTDSQFKGFLRFMLDAIKDAEDEKEKEKHETKINKIVDNIQKTLED